MKKFLIHFGLFVIMVAIAAQSGAYELSADMITKDGDQKQTGKLYVKGKKYRVEVKNGSEYAIIRHDQKRSWIVMPEQKAYIEMPFDPRKTPVIEGKNVSEVNRRLLGTESVDGRLTNKYRVTAKEGGNDASFYQWIATDLNFPVKTSAINGSWSIEYQNIKTSVADSLFEIPESYEKITMPSKNSEAKRLR